MLCPCLIRRARGGIRRIVASVDAEALLTPATPRARVPTWRNNDIHVAPLLAASPANPPFGTSRSRRTARCSQRRTDAHTRRAPIPEEEQIAVTQLQRV